jgi:hypothetical protein
VLCTIDAVWLGTEGCTDGIAQAGLPPLAQLYGEFVDNGGRVCGACTKPRGITDDHLIKGSTIVGAAKVVEEVVSGAKTVAFACLGWGSASVLDPGPLVRRVHVKRQPPVEFLRPARSRPQRLAAEDSPNTGRGERDVLGARAQTGFLAASAHDGLQPMPGRAQLQSTEPSPEDHDLALHPSACSAGKRMH